MIAPGYLKGGEACEVVGVLEQGPLKFSLPRWQVSVTYRIDQQDVVRDANLDTVWLDCDRLRLALTWRAVCPCDKRTLRVREIQADCRPV